MHFKQFQIKNFQSHKDTIIHFSSGLNLIVGPTNVGKSAILRALRKLIRDEPSGKAFISKWATSTELILTIDVDGVEHTITRKVTPTQNLYYLDTQTFGGFGKTGIPKEIQDVLDMKLVKLEENVEIDLHFSDQHDMPFMVSKGSAGIRSKLLGAIAGLHVLDRAITRINSDIRAENNNLKHQEDEINKLEAEIDDFPTLWYETELIDTINDAINAVKRKVTVKEDVQRIYSKILSVDDAIRQTQDTLNSFPDISVDINQIEHKIKMLNDIEGIKETLDMYNIQIHQLERDLPPEICANITTIMNKLTLLTKLKDIYEKLLKVRTNAENVKTAGAEADQLDAYVKEHKDILDELGICPTCERPLKG